MFLLYMSAPTDVRNQFLLTLPYYNLLERKDSFTKSTKSSEAVLTIFFTVWLEPE